MIFKACALNLIYGKSLHSEVIKPAVHFDVKVGTSMLDMYAKGGCIVDAGKMFDEMPVRNGVTINVVSSIKKVDYMAVIASDFGKAIRRAAGNMENPPDGSHIVVDAGNGAGGFFAAKGLEPLGAIITDSQFLEPDGMFPTHIPNPEGKAAMKTTTKAVLDGKTNLGTLFDTGDDRTAAVGSSGQGLIRNHLMALMFAIVLEENPGTTIVTGSVTFDRLTSLTEKIVSGKHNRFKRGYKNVIDICLNSVEMNMVLQILIGLFLLETQNLLKMLQRQQNRVKKLPAEIKNRIPKFQSLGQGLSKEGGVDMVQNR